MLNKVHSTWAEYLSLKIFFFEIHVQSTHISVKTAMTDTQHKAQNKIGHNEKQYKFPIRYVEGRNKAV